MFRGGSKIAYHNPMAKAKKNKLGVKNSLVNNINARKKKGISRSKKNTTIAHEEYSDMKSDWEKVKPKKKK